MRPARKTDTFHSHGAMQRYALEALAPLKVAAKRNGEIVLRDTCIGVTSRKERRS